MKKCKAWFYHSKILLLSCVDLRDPGGNGESIYVSKQLTVVNEEGVSDVVAITVKHSDLFINCLSIKDSCCNRSEPNIFIGQYE